MKINKISCRHSNYPVLLSEIASPPKELYYLGGLPVQEPCIAIVGSRKFTPYGKAMTHKLAYDLASVGVTIVSGLALGIDAIAHQAALEAGGKTIAVMAGGLDKVYPSSHRALATKMLENGGALVSEFEPGVPPYKQNFVARNRITAGLCLGVIVTEAPAHSGALITANFALQQDRVVMAVPADATKPSSEGCNNLIKSGATLVTTAQDVLAALEFEAPELKAKTIKPASKEEAAILELLAAGVNDSEELILQLAWEAAKFNQVITLMEISGKVRSLGAGKWLSR